MDYTGLQILNYAVCCGYQKQFCARNNEQRVSGPFFRKRLEWLWDVSEIFSDEWIEVMRLASSRFGTEVEQKRSWNNRSFTNSVENSRKTRPLGREDFQKWGPTLQGSLGNLMLWGRMNRLEPMIRWVIL